MTLADILIAVVWAGVTAYAVLGGADFGAGVLHLLAPTGWAGRRRRDVVTTAMGPTWEANHVWLIYVLTGLLTMFPDAFAALGAAALAPASLALLAIVVRGAALAFGGQLSDADWAGRPVRVAFGLASAAAPLVMGALAGGLARQRLTVTGGQVHAGGGAALWIGPWQGVIGLLALASCTALAAALLAVRLEGRGEWTLAAGVRRQGRAATIAMLVLSAVALVLARSQAPQLYAGLTGRALPAVITGFAALLGAVWANAVGRDRWAAGGLALAVVALIWGWGIAQFPVLVGPGVTVGSSHAPDAELHAVAIALGAGAILLTPSLWLLHGAFRRTARAGR